MTPLEYYLACGAQLLKPTIVRETLTIKTRSFTVTVRTGRWFETWEDVR